MVSVVLTELEGVIAETRPLRRVALGCAVREEGAALDDAALDELAALPVAAAVRAALARAGHAVDETAADLAALRAERHFAERAGRGLSLAAGAREFVEGAQARARLAVVTRASRREAELVLGLAGLDAAFECVVAAEDVSAPKPDGEGYERALARLARRRPVARGTTVALEDGAVGIRAARAARLRVVAVGAVPAHDALAADASLPSLAGQDVAALDALLAAESVR